MSKRFVTTTCIALIAVLGYGLYFGVATAESAALVGDGQETALQWIQMEFDLNDDEIAAIEELYAVFRPRCETLCRELSKQRREFASLPSSDVSPSVIEAAQSRLRLMEQRCAQMTRDHVEEVARALRPKQGANYRTHMLNRLSHNPDHHRSVHFR